MKLFKVTVLLAFVLTIGVSAIFADEDDSVPMIEDGRVNAWDIAAPVVIYCTFDYPYSDDPDMGVLDTIELWALVTIDDNVQGSMVLEVSADTIEEVGYSTDSDTVIASASGFTLVRATDASLYVTAPADAEGKVYSFSWEFGDEGC
jgi:hypothetical protein